MGMKMKGRPTTCNMRHSVTVSKLVWRSRRVRLYMPGSGGDVSERDHETGVKFSQRAACEEHHEHHDEARWG